MPYLDHLNLQLHHLTGPYYLSALLGKYATTSARVPNHVVSDSIGKSAPASVNGAILSASLGNPATTSLNHVTASKYGASAVTSVASEYNSTYASAHGRLVAQRIRCLILLPLIPNH
jgi:hypothetical protein